MSPSSVLFDPFRVFNCLCNFLDLFLFKQHVSHIKWKVLDAIPQELISVLSYHAKLRHWFCSLKRDIICPLWKMYDISNTWPTFIETNSYWRSFSQVQSIFILWLRKLLLPVTGWLEELQQIASFHSLPRIHEKARFGSTKGLRRMPDATSNTRPRAVALYRPKEMCDACLLSPSNHVHIPQTWNDAGEEFRPSCWHQCYINPT